METVARKIPGFSTFSQCNKFVGPFVILVIDILDLFLLYKVKMIFSELINICVEMENA